MARSRTRLARAWSLYPRYVWWHHMCAHRGGLGCGRWFGAYAVGGHLHTVGCALQDDSPVRVELASEASLSRFAGSAVVVRPLLACSLTLVHIGVCVVWLLPAVHSSRSWVPCVRMELLLKCAVRPLEIASVRWLGHTRMGAWSKVHVMRRRHGHLQRVLGTRQWQVQLAVRVRSVLVALRPKSIHSRLDCQTSAMSMMRAHMPSSCCNRGASVG